MRFGLFASLFILAGSSLLAAEIPADVLEAVSNAPGVVVHVGATDGKVEIQLAEGGKAVVEGLAMTAEHREKSRATVRETKPGSSIVINVPLEKGRLPYADNLVSAVVADLDALGKQVPSEDELLRVLSPGGAAHVKQQGQWRKLSKRQRQGSDDWTHFYHDAGGNPVSQDDEVGPPTGLQWIAGVVGAGADPTTGYRLGEGRAVYEWRRPDTDKRSPANTWLVCRDAYSGVLLWRKLTSVPPFKTRPIVLADGRVFAHLEPEGPLVALDAKTGEVLTTFDEGGRVDKPVNGRASVNIVWHDGLLVETIGNTVYVLDGRTGELKWKHAGDEGTFMDLPTVLADTGQLFVTNGITGRDVGRYPGADARGVLAFNLKSGKLQWHRELGKELSQLSVADGALYAFNLAGFIGRRRDLFIARIDPRDGAVKWKIEPGKKGQLLDMAVIGNRIYVMSLRMEVYDTETGELVADYNMPGNSRCDMSRASKNYLLMSFGNFIDLETDPLQLQRAEISRSTCGGGTTPAYGMLYYTPNRCQCFVSLRGYLATSRESVRQPLDDELRLQAGRASVSAKPDSNWPAEDEWPIYLATPRRNSANQSQLPSQLKLLWKKQLAKPTDPEAGPIQAETALSSNYNGLITSATIADGRAYVAAPELHQVLAVDAATGEKLWSYTAGARIDTPPTIYQGLCLFGGRDGWVYALDAKTGELAWRFFAAPYERNIVAYNQLESSWPLFGSISIADGLVVAITGRHPETNGGLFAWGLEAATGKQVWKHNIGHVREPGPLGGKIPDEGITTRRYGYNANKVLNELLISDGKHVATTGLVLRADNGEIVEEPQIQRKDGKIINPWTYPMSTYFDLGFRPPYRNQELENYGGPGADHGSWLLKLEQPKLEVHGELIAYSDRRVAVTRVAGIEWAMWDLTKPFLLESDKRDGPRRQNSSHPPHWFGSKHQFRDQAAKSILLTKDKLVVGFGRFTGQEAPSRPDEKPISRAEVRIFNEQGELEGELDLPAGVIQSGLSSAYGRLFVTCGDGTLSCFGQ